jgi:hypothetical protein
MIAATFHGPNHFLPNHDESTIEVFDNIGHAISALFDRYDAKGERPLPARYLDGNGGDIPFRFVEKGDSFECYVIPDDFADEAMPGMDEGVIEDALTAVHIGLWNYRLVLRLADDRSAYVTVEKR